MQSFTVTQWAIVALVFVAGWLLGLASHPGGRKWRERYAAEREAHAASRKEADQRIATAETRHRELEIAHARATEPVAATPGPVTTRPRRGAVAPGERRGWFDWGDRVFP